MASLGDLVLNLTADIGQYSSGLKSAQDMAKSFKNTVDTAASKVGKGLAGIGISSVAMGTIVAQGATAAATALLQFATEAINLGDKIEQASIRTGVGAKALSELKFAAEQSDTSFEALQKGLLKLTATAGKSLTDPLGASANAFNRLGISVEELRNKSPDQILSLVADGANRLSDPLEKASALSGVLGKGFAELAPLLKEGSSGLAALSAEAERLGLSIGPDAAANSAEFLDALDKLKSAASGLAVTLVTDLGPSLISLAEGLLSVIISIRDFAKPIIEGLRLAIGDALEAIDSSPIGAFNKIANEAREAAEAANAASAQASAGTAEGMAAVATAAEAEAEAVTLSKKALDEHTNGRKNAKLAADLLAESTKRAAAAEVVAKAALEGRVAGFIEARKAQGEFSEAQKRASVSSRAFVTSVLDSANPLNKLSKAYEENIRRVTESTDLDVRKSLALRILKRDYEAEAFAIRRRNEEAKKQPLTEELANVVALTAARKLGIREYEIEALVQRNLSSIRASSADELARETAALRERSAALVDANAELQNQQRGAPTGLSDAFNRALGDGLKKVSFTEFFTRFTDQFAAALRANPLQVAADVAGLAQTIASATRGSGSDVRRGVSELIASANIPIISQIAQVASAIDAIFGGKLFGTNFAQTASGVAVAFSDSGAFGSALSFLERQRSLFRGRQFSTETTALSGGEAAALRQFFDAIKAAMAVGSRALGVEIPALITGAFREVKDKDGKIKEQISEVGGRIFKEGFEDFQRRLSAENIIAVVSQSAAEATNIAEQWRESAEKLLDGARLLLIAQTDIKNGVGLLAGGALGDVVEFVQRLAKPGEDLSATYLRLATNSNLVRSAIDAISTSAQTATATFVEFADGLVTALGGLDRAGQIIGRALEEFFTPAERAAAASAARARRLAESQVAFNLALGADSVLPLPMLITRALAGVYTPAAAAAIFAYADAVGATRIAARESADAAQALADKEAELAAARRESLAGLDALLQSIEAQLQDIGGSDFSRSQRGITNAFAATVSSIDAFSLALGGTVDVTRGYAAAQALANAQIAQLQRDTRGSILRGLISLYDDAAAQLPATQNPTQFIGLNNRGPGFEAATQVDKWRASLERLERESATLGIARNIRDLFKSLGKGTLDGLKELGVPVSQFLRDLGLDLTNLTGETATRFGAIARELGLTLEELATLSGFDLSSLTPEQRALAEAAIAQKDAIEKQQTDIADLLGVAKDAEIARADQAAAQLVSLQDLVLLNSQILAQLGALTAQNAALTERLARSESRAALGV